MAFHKQGGWLAGVGVVFLAGLSLFFTRTNGEPVQVTEVKQEELVSSLTTNGKVEPNEDQELRAAAPGFVRRLLVKEGDAVKRGQVLLELERGQAAAEAARAQAELEAAEAELQKVEGGGSVAELHETERKMREARAARDEAARVLAADERLLARNAIAKVEVEKSRERLRQAEREATYLEQLSRKRYSDEERQQARARLNSARTSLAYARQQLGLTRATAPIAGIVYSLPVREGNFLKPGDLLARVGNLERARVRVFVDEPELGRVAAGQQVRVTWDALPGQEWRGAVERVPAEVTTLGTRSVGEVVCTIDNSGRKLLANVNVDVEIILKRRPAALTLPREAVIHAGGAGQAPDGHHVFVVDSNVLRRRPVKLGVSSATRYEIASGLQAGQKVALPGDRRLADGMKVKVVE